MDELCLPDDAQPLGLLLAVARDPHLPLHTRLRAAIAAAPFVHPKLGATAIIPFGEDFATRLERAVLRSAKARLAAEPATIASQSFKRRV